MVEGQTGLSIIDLDQTAAESEPIQTYLTVMRWYRE